MSRYEGLNCQAGCPTTVLIRGENKRARNSENVVSPERGTGTQKPGGNEMGSQLSTSATLGSWLFTCAGAMVAPTAHTPTNIVSPYANILTLRIFETSIMKNLLEMPGSRRIRL